MTSAPRQRSGFEAALNWITDVRAGEGQTAILLTFNVFILLSAYYVVKPVREALILVLEGGAEYKSYASAIMAVLLLILVPLYARFANRVPRNLLVTRVTLFFVLHLVLFYVASQVPSVRNKLGIIFYLWVGIFNMMVVAQFWAFANDVYSEEQGKRLFALVGLGASSGAVVGSWMAGRLIEPIGVYQMLLVAAGMLSLCAVLFQVVHTRESANRDSHYVRGSDDAAETKESATAERGSAFGLVLSNRYLSLLAAFSLVFTFANTNGEYMLSRIVSDYAAGAVESGRVAADGKGAFIGATYGDFFFYVNSLSLFMQAFLVSRLVKYLGLGPSFYIFPIISLLDAAAIAIAPVFAIIRVGKTLENATDYSLNNTLRQMLWLPTTREMKYKAKQAVDTFFVRMGDVASALLVFAGVQLLGWSISTFALSNVVLIGVWIVVATMILRENGRLRRKGDGDTAAATEHS